MGADLARVRRGEKSQTGMSESQLEDFARRRKKKGKKLPTHGSGPLTPLGSKTLAGFQEKWGDEDGKTKFHAAMDAGTLSRDRMMKIQKRSAAGSFSTRIG
jgi:hypothetical protein